MADQPQTGGSRGVTPYLTVGGGKGAEAVEFYKKAFGAAELFRQPADDGKRVLHCSLLINGGPVMLSDDFSANASPAPAGVTLHLNVGDADAIWNQAMAAGPCEVAMPLDNQFWGDRYGILKDPYGHRWSIGGPKKG
jgi:PhnB protein